MCVCVCVCVCLSVCCVEWHGNGLLCAGVPLRNCSLTYAVLTTIHLNIWLGIHLTRLSTEGLGPRHGEVRRAHQMLNAALDQSVVIKTNCRRLCAVNPRKTLQHSSVHAPSPIPALRNAPCLVVVIDIYCSDVTELQQKGRVRHGALVPTRQLVQGRIQLMARAGLRQG